ncbi:MAG: hypothetical protein J0H98_05715 [Solirubrobacterales bacterium]|nr:hypothetical protein [Solirubrobacterales bacterium]
MLRKIAICALMATTLVAAGCGGSDDSTSDADSQAINALVDELNRVTAEKDAAGFCDVILPSQVESTFHGKGRCVKETKAILVQAGDQPAVKVENIKVDGDQAEVEFADKSGQAIFIKEGGKWYLPLSTDDTSASSSDSSGSEG